ncbi:MAG: hypothetical protein ACR2GY_01770 [Phycisphaerales bacterium]
MAFRSGTLSYARFKVQQHGGSAAPQLREVTHDHLETLRQNVLTPGEIGEPRPVEFGWCGGRHVFDERFAPDSNVFGETLLAGLRCDTNKVPAELKRAYRAMAETAFAEEAATGFLSRREKLAAREEAEERCRRELVEGRHRRSKCLDVAWTLPTGIVLAPAFSDAHSAGLRDLFQTSFEARLVPLSSGTLAYDILAARGRSRDYDDLRPTAFTSPPAGYAAADDVDAVHALAGADGGRPQASWAFVTPEASDFLGNEFLMWLWWRSDEDDAAFDTNLGLAVVAIDRVLDMECPWSVTGKQMLKADAPARSPEARRGLKNGKWPRKAGLMMSLGSQQQFECVFQSDRFQFTALKLPPADDDVTSLREIIEHRLTALQDFDRAMTAIYTQFLDVRASHSWPGVRDRMARWIAGRRSASPAEISVEVKQPVAVGS